MVSVIQQAGYGAIVPDETVDGQDAEQATRDAEIKDQTQNFNDNKQPSSLQGKSRLIFAIILNAWLLI